MRALGQLKLTDTELFADLYRQMGDKLWRALVGYSGDRDLAADAVSEAFAQAMARGPSLRAPDAWIWKAAFRIAGGELKRRAQLASPVDEAPGHAYSESPEPITDLIAALRRLSPHQRAAVILHDYADRPTREVSETLGMTAATVYVHLSQGRRRLRRLLEDLDE